MYTEFVFTLEPRILISIILDEFSIPEKRYNVPVLWSECNGTHKKNLRSAVDDDLTLTSVITQRL